MFILQDKLTIALQPGAIAGYVAGLVFLTAVAALLPALRAARLKPVTAMHHIG
jgi:ABC-type lipoprotein release transport system permease subunit